MVCTGLLDHIQAIQSAGFDLPFNVLHGLGGKNLKDPFLLCLLISPI